MKSTNNQMAKFVSEAIKLYSKTLPVLTFKSLSVKNVEYYGTTQNVNGKAEISSVQFELEVGGVDEATKIRKLVVYEITNEGTKLEAKWLTDYEYKLVEAPGRRW